MANYSKYKTIAGKLILIISLVVYTAFSLNLSVTKPVWRDEAFSILISKQSIFEIIQSTSSDFNPPLFYVILHLWQYINSDVISLRILPLIFSILTILTIYLTIPNLFQIKKISFKLILLLLLISNGSIFYYSYELRPYSMLMLFAYLASYYGYRYLNEQNPQIKIMLMISSIILIYTQTMGIVWFVLNILILSLYLIFQKKWRILKKFIFIWLVVSIFYLPWTYIILSQFQKFGDSFWLEFKPEEKLQNLSALFAFNEGPLHFSETIYKQVYLYLYRILGAILIFNLFKRGFTRFISLLIIINLVGLYYISYNKPLFYGRYFVYLAPLASILLSLSVYWLISRNMRSILLKSMQYVILIIFFGAYGYSNYYLWQDYKFGVARVNYFPVKKAVVDSFYVTSDLDIMPCMIYQNDCMYVRGENEIKNYIGFLQLKYQPILDSWDGIRGSNIGVICRHESCHMAINTLNNNNYQQIRDQDLGDGVKMIEFNSIY